MFVIADNKSLCGFILLTILLYELGRKIGEIFWIGIKESFRQWNQRG